MSTSQRVFRPAAVQSEIFQRIDQQWRIVEALRANEGKVQATGRLLKCNIDVVQDLNMITKKADWLNHNSVITVMLEARQRVFARGAKPGSAAHSLTLETEVTVALTYTIPQFGCDKLRGQLAVVGIR